MSSTFRVREKWQLAIARIKRLFSLTKDKSGKLPAKRTPTNQRYYTDDDLRVARGLQKTLVKRRTIVDCRVSSKKQLKELENPKKIRPIAITSRIILF